MLAAIIKPPFSVTTTEIAASDLPLAKLEMIGRVLMGARVDKIKTNELKRDVLLYAREDPEGFLEMLDDSDLELEELVIKAFDQNIIAFRKQKASHRQGGGILEFEMDRRPRHPKRQRYLVSRGCFHLRCRKSGQRP